MITGCNQDVTYKGRVYHVQTEDRGKANPVIETLIYSGGEILASQKISYSDLLASGYDESKIAAMLEQQHRRVVVDVKLGKYAKEEAKAFGEGIVTGKSLDEVILDYLTSESEGEKLVVSVLDQGEMASGSNGHVHMKAASEISQSPVMGAQVLVTLATSDGLAKQLFKGTTNAGGICLATFAIPAVSESAIVIVDVSHPRGGRQLKYLVTRQP